MNVESMFHQLLEQGIGEQAAATLCLAAAVNQLRASNDEWSHQLCLGIRKGLFGAHAGNNASIHNHFMSSADD